MVETVKIGKSDVTTIKLGLGANKVGGHNLFQDLNEQDGYDLLRESIAQGVNFLDTAFDYGRGRSEEIIGDVLQEYDRSKVIVADKAAQDPAQNFAMNNTPQFLKEAVDKALKRLKTDYIDIFYIHFPDEKTPKDEAVDALVDLKKAGKIRAIGVSNFSLEQIKEANKNGQVDIVEDQFSLIYKSPAQEEMQYLKDHQISFVPYFPLASGLLTGKYTKADWNKFHQSDGGKLLEDLTEAKFNDAIAGLEQVRTIAQAHDATVTQVVLAWYMANPLVSVVIPGARNVKQVQGNAAALKVNLTANEYQTIDQAFGMF